MYILSSIIQIFNFVHSWLKRLYVVENCDSEVHENHEHEKSSNLIDAVSIYVCTSIRTYVRTYVKKDSLTVCIHMYICTCVYFCN